MLETAIPAAPGPAALVAVHWRVVIALGVSWLLDGLEVTVVRLASAPLCSGPTRSASAPARSAGRVRLYRRCGAWKRWSFGRLADSLGRKRMFLVTLAVYLVGTVLTAFSFDIWSFALCRALTGFGIGGE